jgi:pilus assembly protein Flp/PilA
MLAKFFNDESGATAIEYGLIAAGISVAIIAVVQGLGSKLNSTFTSVQNALNWSACLKRTRRPPALAASFFLVFLAPFGRRPREKSCDLNAAAPHLGRFVHRFAQSSGTNRAGPAFSAPVETLIGRQ